MPEFQSKFKNEKITINMNIFTGGKFCKKKNGAGGMGGGVIFLHKGIWVLFSRGGNFHEEDKIVKNTKITPTRKISMFTVI